MTFDPFGDFETAGYLRNAHQLTDLSLIKRLEHAAFEANIEQALAYLAQTGTIDYPVILRVHEMLFSTWPWPNPSSTVTAEPFFWSIPSSAIAQASALTGARPPRTATSQP